MYVILMIYLILYQLGILSAWSNVNSQYTNENNLDDQPNFVPTSDEKKSGLLK